MCDPISLLVAGTAISSGTALLSGLAQGHLAEAEAKARADQLKYQAEINDQNAYLADIRAKEALGIAATDALVPDIASHRVISSMRAQAGASGLTLGKGFVTLETDVDRRRHKAQSRLLRAGDKASYAETLDAHSLRTTGELQRHGAATAIVIGKARKKAAIYGGIAGAASTALGGATSIATL